MSMPERLRQAVTARLGSLDRSIEQRLRTREGLIDELEHRGYRIRGKTDEQIVQALRHETRNSA